MKETIDAVYENGVFRPLKEPRIPQGKHVVLEIEVPESRTPAEVLKLATKVFDGLSESDIDEIASSPRERGSFFDRDLEWPSK